MQPTADDATWSLAKFHTDANVPFWLSESTLGIIDPGSWKTRLQLKQPEGDRIYCARQLEGIGSWVIVSTKGAVTLVSVSGQQLAHHAPTTPAQVPSQCWTEASKDGEALLLSLGYSFPVTLITAEKIRKIPVEREGNDFDWLSSSSSFYVNAKDSSAHVYERNEDVSRFVGKTRSVHPDGPHKEGWLVTSEPEGHSTLWKLPSLQRQAVLAGTRAEFAGELVATSEGDLVRAYSLKGELLWTKRQGVVLPLRGARTADYILIGLELTGDVPGYALLDPRSGKRLIEWPHSGNKCSYSTVQRNGTFGMFEGGRVHFQTAQGGHTAETRCRGTHSALFYREGTHAVIFDTIFNWFKRAEVAKLEEVVDWLPLPEFTLTHSDTAILGQLESHGYPHPRNAAMWDPKTGKLLRQLRLDQSRLSASVPYSNPNALSLHVTGLAEFWGVFEPQSRHLVWRVTLVRDEGERTRSKLLSLEPGCEPDTVPTELKKLIDEKHLQRICDFEPKNSDQ